jgi:phage baseplate assembly protein gpV
VVITGENTRFWVPGVEEASLDDIAVGDTVVAGGTMTEEGLRAVVVAVVPERPQRAVRRGVVTANDGTTLTLETAGGTITVVTGEQTRFRVAGVENPTIDDVQVGFQALAAGRLDPQDGTLQALLVGARPAPADQAVH